MRSPFADTLDIYLNSIALWLYTAHTYLPSHDFFCSRVKSRRIKSRNLGSLVSPLFLLIAITTLGHLDNHIVPSRARDEPGGVGEREGERRGGA